MQLDPRFADAVALIDAGDAGELECLLAIDPALAIDRAENDEHAYFRDPYLLWFVAENPVRNGALPKNIAEVTRVILRAAQHQGIDRSVIDYALELVSSGRVPREYGVQRALIDVLCDAGADPNSAMKAALAHHEVDAVERLIERGARVSLLVAACLDRLEDAERLARDADASELQLALAGAALYGNARILSMLVDRGGIDLNAFAPPRFHAHATPLHHAVDSGSLDAVKVLVRAGADRTIRDRVYHGTPLDWAEHLGRSEIAAWLRG